MPPARVTFIWSPDPVVYAEAIEAVRLALQNRAAPLAVASETVQHDISERFRTETDPDGESWEPWSPAYKPVALAYPNIGILQQSGELAEVASSTQSTMITNDTVFYKTGALPHYGLAHEQGLPDRTSPKGANPLPKRSFLGMSEESAAIVFKAFNEWFDRSIDLFITARGRIGRRHALRGAVPGFRGMQFIPRAAVGKGPLA